MNTVEVLENIQNQIEEAKGNELVTVLLNVIENLYSENEKLKEENRNLKEKLTGDKSPPIEKQESKNNISSETERKIAESAEDEKKEGFKLDSKTLRTLEEKRIPVKVLKKLKELKGEKYDTEEQFVEAVKILIGKGATNRHIDILLKYARYKKRNRKPKIPDIPIDRVEKCNVDKSLLPDDAINKGYETKVVQNLIIQRDNVKFEREKFYSPSLKKTILAELPVGYEGDFGPDLNAVLYTMKYVNTMSIPKSLQFIQNYDILISKSYVTSLLSNDKYMAVFHEEKTEIFQAMLETGQYLQIDDTGCIVNGEKHYTQIACNAFATVFFTTKRKNRLSVLDVLRNFEPRKFIFNEEAFMLLQQFKVSKKLINHLNEVEKHTVFNQEQMDAIISSLSPNNKPIGQTTNIRIMEATAIAYYHQQTEWPVVNFLVADDASQFKLLAKIGLMLCWIHEGRHYKRLEPIVPVHKKEVDDFLKKFWDFYKKLFNFKKLPTEEEKQSLSLEFDEVFSSKIEYDKLSDRIAKSKAKKESLLRVLEHPELPLHNNRSENGARVEKRCADVSLQTRSDAGTAAKDTMNTIIETAKKLGVSAIRYIHDRMKKINKMPKLADLIRSMASRQSSNNSS